MALAVTMASPGWLGAGRRTIWDYRSTASLPGAFYPEQKPRVGAPRDGFGTMGMSAGIRTVKTLGIAGNPQV